MADVASQIAALEARLAAVESQPASAPAVEKKTGLTFTQAAEFLKRGKRITRAAAPWNGRAWLLDCGLLPHWGLQVDNALPVIWPTSNGGVQLKMDLAAQDWMVLE